MKHRRRRLRRLRKTQARHRAEYRQWRRGMIAYWRRELFAGRAFGRRAYEIAGLPYIGHAKELQRFRHRRTGTGMIYVSSEIAYDAFCGKAPQHEEDR